MRKLLRRRSILIFIIAIVLGVVSPSVALAQEPGQGLGLLPSEYDGPLLDTSALGLKALPPAVDLSGGLPPVGNQRSQNSCVGWAVGYYYKTYQEGLERNWNLADPAHQFSPSFVYNQRPGDCTQDIGTTMYTGLNVIKTKGALPLSEFPYDRNDACTKPTQAQLDAAWPYRSDSFAAIFAQQGAANISTLKSLLVNEQAFVIAIPIYTSFYGVSYNNPVVPVPAQGETLYGGHAMLVVGYDDAMGGFLTVNSWGSTWARNGFCYLSYDLVSQKAWEAWLMTDHVEQVTPAPPQPATTYGLVTVDGRPAASGTSIGVYVEGLEIAATATYLDDGVARYAVQIPADDPATEAIEGATNGDTYRFRVNGIYQDDNYTWSPGETVVRDFCLVTSSSHMLDSWIRNYGLAAGGWADFDTFPRMLGDVNGDGKADVVGFGNRATYVSLSDGEAFGAPTPWIYAYGPAAGGWSSFDVFPRRLADVNGDGKADVVAFGNRATYVSLSDGTRFGAPTPWVYSYGPAAGGWSDFDTFPRQLADVNADGRADIVAFGNRATYVSLSDGTRFGAPTPWVYSYGPAAGGWGNFDTFPRHLADVNGDGRADIVAFGNRATYVSLSDGARFSAPVSWLLGYGPAAGGWTDFETFPRMLGDLNGDGKADIVAFGSSATYVSFSTGAGFTPALAWIGALGTNAGGWSSHNIFPRAAADVNGDGRDDLVGFGSTGTMVDVTTFSIQAVTVSSTPAATDDNVSAHQDDVQQAQTQSAEDPEHGPVVPALEAESLPVRSDR